jgi:hypothetical protein
VPLDRFEGLREDKHLFCSLVRLSYRFAYGWFRLCFPVNAGRQKRIVFERLLILGYDSGTAIEEKIQQHPP